MQNPEAAGLEWLNALPPDEAANELLKCCGSTRWAQTMAQRRPFTDIEELTRAANDIWRALKQTDWLEAFRSHPKIGEQKAAERVSTQSQQWSGQEQSGVRAANQDTMETLAQLNREYEARFGFIYIVCASGKSAGEM